MCKSIRQLHNTLFGLCLLVMPCEDLSSRVYSSPCSHENDVISRSSWNCLTKSKQRQCFLHPLPIYLRPNGGWSKILKFQRQVWACVVLVKGGWWWWCRCFVECFWNPHANLGEELTLPYYYINNTQTTFFSSSSNTGNWSYANWGSFQVFDVMSVNLPHPCFLYW